MNKVYIIAVTVAIETLSLWLVSLFFGWSFIDTIFFRGTCYIWVCLVISIK